MKNLQFQFRSMAEVHRNFARLIFRRSLNLVIIFLHRQAAVCGMAALVQALAGVTRNLAAAAALDTIGGCSDGST